MRRIAQRPVEQIVKIPVPQPEVVEEVDQVPKVQRQEVVQEPRGEFIEQPVQQVVDVVVQVAKIEVLEQRPVEQIVKILVPQPEGVEEVDQVPKVQLQDCLLYTSPSPRDLSTSRMPSSA